MDCKNQEEVNELRNKLISFGGRESSQSGWFKNKHGLQQIFPKRLGELMGNPNPEKQASVASHAQDAKDYRCRFTEGLRGLIGQFLS